MTTLSSGHSSRPNNVESIRRVAQRCCVSMVLELNVVLGGGGVVLVASFRD